MNRPNITTPNPKCCSDPRYLCPRCSTRACDLALNSAADFLRRQSRRPDPQAILPVPVINWAEASVTAEAECQCKRMKPPQTRNTRSAGLAIPKPNWTEWAKT